MSLGQLPFRAGFIFEPGATALPAVGVVFTDFGLLIDAVARQPIGAPVPVFFSDRAVGVGNPIVIPARALNAPYDTLGRTMDWFGTHLGSKTVVHLDDGVSFVPTLNGRMPVIALNMDIQPHCFASSLGSNLVPFTVSWPGPDPSAVVCRLGAEFFIADGDLPVVDVVDGCALIVGVMLSSVMNRGSHQSVRLLGPTAFCGALALDRGVVAGDVFEGPGTALLLVAGTAATVDPLQPAIGTVVLQVETKAVNLGSPVAVPGNFAVSDPVNQQEYNDRVATALAGLLGGPIP